MPAVIVDAGNTHVRFAGWATGDTVPPRLRSGGVSIVTRSARLPIASFSMASTSWFSTPGSERMSTSISTRSGMTFTFVPPWAMLGEKVVCVQAWASRARARLSMPRTVSSTRVASVRPAVSSGPRSMAFTYSRHTSRMRAFGW